MAVYCCLLETDLLNVFQFHFFVAEGILSYCLVNGWSTNLQGKHRKTIHVVLQLCGVICAVVGTTHTMVMKPGTISSHCVTGDNLYILSAYACMHAYELIASKINKAN